MRNRLAAVLAALIIVAALPTAVQAAHFSTCQQMFSAGSKAGDNFLQHLGGRDGVSAKIQFIGQFSQCSDPAGGDWHSATSAWVGLEGGGGIVQVGIMKCDMPSDPGWGNSPCWTFRNQLRFFYAFGGCNLNSPWARDLGPADFGVHKYKLYKSTVGGVPSVFFTIDDVIKATVPTSTAWGCWFNPNTNSGFVACETKDDGDSCGGSAGAKMRFFEIRQRRADTATWYLDTNVGAPCAVTGTNSGRYLCQVVNGTTADLWSSF